MNSTEGRVEFCLGGRWGSICETDWDDDNAEVVCRQLGIIDANGIYGIKYISFSSWKWVLIRGGPTRSCAPLLEIVLLWNFVCMQDLCCILYDMSERP